MMQFIAFVVFVLFIIQYFIIGRLVPSFSSISINLFDNNEDEKSVDKIEIEKPSTYIPLVYGFYHVFTSFNVHHSIVSEQIRHLKSTGAYDILESIKYTVVGEHDYHIDDKKFIHGSYVKEGHEERTLIQLYELCQTHPLDFVLYFHPKGSFSEAGSEKEFRNRKFRSMLNFFVLHKKCYVALNNGYDVCGARLSPLPYLHYSGNFWWARCSYVNTLINPRKMVVGSNLQNLSVQNFPTIYTHCLGLQRFFSEAWIASGPQLYGADCIPGGRGYLYGYDLPPNILNLVLHSSHCPKCFIDEVQCTEAASNRSFERIDRAIFDLYWGDYKNMFLSSCCGMLEQNIERGKLWYGNESQHTSLISMRMKYGDYVGVNLSAQFNHPLNYSLCLANGGFTPHAWKNVTHW
eukprot:gene13600-18254_t